MAVREDDRLAGMTPMRWFVLAAAVLASAFGLARLGGATSGLEVTTAEVDGTPVTVFRAAGPPAPVVVIAHGFAGSQQFMQPFAITLARSGYLVVTYDLLGHGRNPMALTGDVTRVEGAPPT
jgi:predicted alpha/beta-fold hydrolase